MSGNNFGKIFKISTYGESHGRAIGVVIDGCPADLDYQESHENKQVFLQQGNHATVDAYQDKVDTTLNEKEHNSHIIPFYDCLVVFSAYGHHVPQSMLVRNGKARLIWDGSTKCNWWETTMNEVTPTDREAGITFGYVYMAFCILIFNLRISFPNEEILLAFIDILSCFRWPRIFPCLVGAFGFMIGPLFMLQMPWFLVA